MNKIRKIVISHGTGNENTEVLIFRGRGSNGHTYGLKCPITYASQRRLEYLVDSGALELSTWIMCKRRLLVTLNVSLAWRLIQQQHNRNTKIS